VVHWRALWTCGAFLLALAALGGGCDPPATHEDQAQSPPAVDGKPVPAGTGAIRGQVRWQGELPTVPPLSVRGNPIAPLTLARRQQRPNPNAPQIDFESRGIGDVLVYLRDCATLRGQPWIHPPVRVEIRDQQLLVDQSSGNRRLGLVQRGAPVEFVSHDSGFHSVQARGAAFFALALPEADRPAVRLLEETGLVVLTSGASHYWMRAHLFVSNHPFCTTTGGRGEFVLERVPPGEYEIVCWLPSWRTIGHERDPETGIVSRLHFAPARELSRPIVVHDKAAAYVQFEIAASPDDINPR
jgi:hypothetical protein